MTDKFPDITPGYYWFKSFPNSTPIIVEVFLGGSGLYSVLPENEGRLHLNIFGKSDTCGLLQNADGTFYDKINPANFSR